MQRPLLGFQRSDACGQLIEFALLLEAQFGARLGCRDRCSHRSRRRHGFEEHFRRGRRQAARTLCSPVFDATFVLAPQPRRDLAFVRNQTGDNVVQKPAIVTDQKHGAGVVLQQLFEQLQRVDVQVIGRLVKHEHIGR